MIVVIINGLIRRRSPSGISLLKIKVSAIEILSINAINPEVQCIIGIRRGTGSCNALGNDRKTAGNIQRNQIIP